MNRSKALTWTELRVGVVAIVSLVMLAITIVYVGSGGGSPWGRKYELKALMSDINGLKTGAPVRVGGLEVGTVKEVDFDRKGGMVEVTMKLDRRVQSRVTTRSAANLGSLGPLGALSRDEQLVADLKSLTSNLNEVAGKLHRGEGSAGRLLQDEGLFKRLDSVSNRLDSLITRVEQGEGSAGRLIRDPEFYNNVNGAAEDVRKLISDIRKDPPRYLRAKV